MSKEEQKILALAIGAELGCTPSTIAKVKREVDLIKKQTKKLNLKLGYA